jgi:hypothetical protein
VNARQSSLDIEFSLPGPRLIGQGSRRTAYRIKNLRLDAAPGAVSFAPVSAAWECSGGHPREVDGASAWYWTARALDCVVTPAEALTSDVVVTFDYYVADSNRRLRTNVAGVVREQPSPGGLTTFRSAPLSAADGGIRITLDLAGAGVVSRISPQDERLGAFYVKDIRLERVRRRDGAGALPR